MKIEKAQWSTDGDAVRIHMPMQKVDQEKRIVSGFATLDNEDTQGDVVLASASRTAFENFRGNIRLMHQPIPAGKLVNFREEEYFDAKTGKSYQGIYVDVYVSKGASDVWEMVLDGTLTGFSIGGSITDQEAQWVKDAGKNIRFVKAYDLIELSLVDSPANQLSNVFSVQKAADGTMSIEGSITEVKTENVFYCVKDEVAFTSTDEVKPCNVCGTETRNIGWFESDANTKTEKVASMVADFIKTTENVEGRENKMADETQEVETPEVETEVVETTEETVEVPAEEVEVPAEETEKEAVVEVEPEAAVEEEAPDFTKAFAALTDTIEKALAGQQETITVELAKVNQRFETIETLVNELSAVKAANAELAEKFAAVTEETGEVKKSLDAINKSVGGKKSGDLGRSSEETKLEKSNTGSIWGGRFSGSVESL
jgi:hypothetical protein